MGGGNVGFSVRGEPKPVCPSLVMAVEAREPTRDCAGRRRGKGQPPHGDNTLTQRRMGHPFTSTRELVSHPVTVSCYRGTRWCHLDFLTGCNPLAVALALRPSIRM
jgi:hypothetical protein